MTKAGSLKTESFGFLVLSMAFMRFCAEVQILFPTITQNNANAFICLYILYNKVLQSGWYFTALRLRPGFTLSPSGRHYSCFAHGFYDLGTM